jgi:transposase InsO family protein
MREKKERTDRAERLRIAKWIMEDRPNPEQREGVMMGKEVVERTLRNWVAERRKELKGEPPPNPPGRPRQKLSQLREPIRRMNAAWQELTTGMTDLTRAPGVPALKRLLPGVSKYLVEKFVAKRKEIARRKQRRQREERRESVTVAPGVVSTLDAKHLGREGGKAIDGHVVRDRGADLYQAVLVGTGATARETAGLARTIVEETPAVAVQVDNGSLYRAAEFQRPLRRARIISIFSLPRTPQHNGSAEQGMKEISSYIPEGGFTDCRSAFIGIRAALHRINEIRPRESRGGLTASALYALKRVEASREECYREYVRRKWRYTREAGKGKRARRMADRRAAFDTLEHFGLATITRGGRRSSAAAERKE